MSDTDRYITEAREAADAEAVRLARGMIFNAALIKRYHEILTATGLPDAIIAVAIDAWCTARSRMEVEPMLHHMYMQQHQAHEGTDDARD